MTPTTLDELLRGLAGRLGDRPALIDAHETLSFAALDAAAQEWARTLTQAGCGPGTHIGLLAGNSAAWLAVAFGVWRAGATLVPISTFVTARELGETLDHADVNLLVVQPRLRTHHYLDALQQLPPLPQLRAVFTLGGTSPGGQSAPRDAAEVRSDAESIACILYTSGTTGRPKGVMLSHRAILATVQPTAERSGLDRSDVLLSTLPLFWVAGLVIRALPTLAAGSSLVLLETFTPDALVAALRRHRPTALHLRPPQVGQLLAHPEFTPVLLARVRKGGGRTQWYAPHLEHAALITGYGMTETAGYVTALDWRDPPAVRRNGLGRLLPGVELRIVGADGCVCPADVTGEVRVRGPGLFSGYYKEPPAAGCDAEGWFRTGDLGWVDAHGTFHFAGRSKDLLRVKGINVSPVEVETLLSTHPAVEAAYVVGLPPDGLDQRLVALIVPKADGAPPSPAALHAFASEALSHYKRPAAYLVIGRADVPLGATVKPQRAALAALAAERAAETAYTPQGHNDTTK